MSTSLPTLQSNNKATDADEGLHPSTPSTAVNPVFDHAEVNHLLMASLADDEDDLTLEEL